MCHEENSQVPFLSNKAEHLVASKQRQFTHSHSHSSIISRPLRYIFHKFHIIIPPKKSNKDTMTRIVKERIAKSVYIFTRGWSEETRKIKQDKYTQSTCNTLFHFLLRQSWYFSTTTTTTHTHNSADTLYTGWCKEHDDDEQDDPYSIPKCAHTHTSIQQFRTQKRPHVFIPLWDGLSNISTFLLCWCAMLLQKNIYNITDHTRKKRRRTWKVEKCSHHILPVKCW